MTQAREWERQKLNIKLHVFGMDTAIWEYVYVAHPKYMYACVAFEGQ